MHTREEKLEAFGRLLDIMDDLREKCPWDMKQTMQSLRVLTIEETYELADAIIDQDLEEVRKELGDLLLHMVFYSKIGEEQGVFDIADVLNGINEKLIYRHPHIYGDTKVANEEEVKQNWEQLKLKEKENKGVLSGVPKSLPSLIQAMRIQEKAAGVGFDWDNKEQVYEKFQEEWQELQNEILNNDAKKTEEEFGDVLFALVNYAKFLKINPDNALTKTNNKFLYRFNFIEAEAKKQGRNIHDLSTEEMNVFWEKAKDIKK